MEGLAESAVEVLKKHAKACAIELVSGAVLDEALEEVKKAIPGVVDDVIISAIKEPLKAAVIAKLQGL